MPERTAPRILTDGFTAHNVLLQNGVQTKPEIRLLADGAIARAAVRMAYAVCPPTEEYTPRVADLGCLEGGYAVEFARAGYDVIGFEARSDSIARCNYVKSGLDLDNLVFIQDDVRNLEQYGAFDIIFCCGLLYHLDLPREFLKLLGRITTRLLLLHTHYAENQPNPNYPLTDLVEHEGLTGRWYPETPITGWTSMEMMEGAAWASWKNTASFWPLKRHLLQAIQEAGFPTVCEQFDALEDIAEDPYTERHSRSMFAGIKVAR